MQALLALETFGRAGGRGICDIHSQWDVAREAWGVSTC